MSGLDIEVARTVMGWNGLMREVPFYSTDPGSAWSVVEKMRSLGWRPTISDNGTPWFVSFSPADAAPCTLVIGSGEAHWDGDGGIVSDKADTMPLAVCRAALAAIKTATGTDA